MTGLQMIKQSLYFPNINAMLLTLPQSSVYFDLNHVTKDPEGNP